jgi:epoxide hydrolase 4
MILRLYSLGLLLIFCFGGTGALAETPSADPAVIHANTVRKDAIAYKEGYFGKGDDRLHYVEAGKGPLIILYHGFPSFWYSWFDQMEKLKGHYRVVAVDGLGAGLSAKPESLEAYRVEKLAGQIDQLARHLNGKRRFTLIGHDWGAALAFAYAQAYPKRLNAVIGMSAPPYNLFLEMVWPNKEQQARSQYMQVFRTVTLDDIRNRNLPEQVWRQSYSKLIEKGDLTKAEGELFRNALGDPLALNGGMNWYRANMPPIDQIDENRFWPIHNSKIAVPVLLIWGEADHTFVPAFLEQMPRYAKNLQIVRLPEINHWTPMERSEQASNEIARFLKGI